MKQELESEDMLKMRQVKFKEDCHVNNFIAIWLALVQPEYFTIFIVFLILESNLFQYSSIDWVEVCWFLLTFYRYYFQMELC